MYAHLNKEIPMKPNALYTHRLNILLSPKQRACAESLAAERGQSVAGMFRDFLDREAAKKAKKAEAKGETK
jgi:hypothetical protein